MTRSLRRAWANIRRRPLSVILATGTIAIVLLLASAVYLATRNLEAATARWGGGVQMVVYLDEGTSPERAEAIAGVLRKLEAIEQVEYVAPELALDRLRRVLGEEDALIEGIEPGMLPASLEVTLGQGVRDVAAAHPLVERLEQTAGVEEVEFVGEWVEQLTSLTAALRYAGGFLFLLVGLAAIYIVMTTLRLSLSSHRGDVEAFDLLGAGSSFTRAPVIAEGIAEGLVGSALATGLLYLLYRTTAETIAGALGSVVGEVEPAFLAAGEIGILLAVGAGCGLVGSWFASGRHA